MDVAVVAEGEVARINCDELILEGSSALPNDAAGFTDGGDVLTNLAFLSELTVGAQLIVTGDRRRVGDIHQFRGALVGEFKVFVDYDFAAVVAGTT